MERASLRRGEHMIRAFWERVTGRAPAVGPDSTGVLRIPRQMVYGLSRFVDANALLDGDDYPQIERQFYRMLHGERGEHISPSLAGSAAFVGALCDAAYLAPMASQRQSAHTLIDQIAAARGVDRQRFELDCLPNCGLDGDIRFVGARGHVYALTIGLGHRPLLRGRGGRMHTGAPHDLDHEQRQLLRRAKLLLGHKLRAQRRRLELAMLGGDRWDAQFFLGEMLPHPLLAWLCRHVLWAGYDQVGNLIEAFIVQEDGSLTSETYGAARVGEYATVGVPHPADIPPERLAAWVELLDDFPYQPLFPQLRRPAPTVRRSPAELTALLATLRFQAEPLCAALRALGWDVRYPILQVRYALPHMDVGALVEMQAQVGVVQLLRYSFERAGLPVTPDQVPPRLMNEVLCHLGLLVEDTRLRAG
ncbi:DUF4132 domain-containing protein [Chloroflexia bacterium SDU3-3]|nr:DUF4132 domain-containing protein [Chloroflexia bacterium SDU3-3]